MLDFRSKSQYTWSMNFWADLKKPVMILAPMEGVTDTVFRDIIVSAGKPDVMFTEFVPVDGLLSDQAKNRLLRDFWFTENQKPIVAQIWGSDPDKFFQVAQVVAKLGFDGIDINMGCPDKNTVKKGACSALIKNPQLAQEIILATIKGAQGLPVSVKTRIGFGEIQTEEWVGTLLKTPIAALTLHLRTVREMSKVDAHWEESTKAVAIRNSLGSKALIIGNGDVKTLDEAHEKVAMYGVDGVMIGRGIFGNPYLFNRNTTSESITTQAKVKLLIKHLLLFKQTWNETKNYEIMKKFVKCYINNFEGSAQIREQLMTSRSLDELIQKTTSIEL